MRPVRLSIAGLHSFRERQEIDFKALTEMGMFGIFGPTGSGKSTILDAITLALYGDVGRAGRNTQAILNHAEKRLEVVFEFDIGASGNRKRYRVERVYKRGQGFSVEHQASRLLELEATNGSEDYGLVVIADNKNQVNQAIRSILGLEQSDFTRAVVLPQGKFAEFLHLTGSERNAMMERLFGLERYGKSLLEKITARAKQVANEHGKIVAGQAELGDASEEAVQAQETAVTVAHTQLQSAEQVRAHALTRLREAEHVHSLIKQYEAAQRERAALAERANEMDIIRRSLEQSAQANAVWPLVEDWRHAETALCRAREHAQACTVAVQEAQIALTQAAENQQAVRNKRAALEPSLLEKKGQLKHAEILETQVISLQKNLTAAEAAHQAACSKKESTLANHSAVLQEVKRITSERVEAEKKLKNHATSPETRRQLTQLRTAFEGWTDRKNSEERALQQYEQREKERQAAEDLLQRERAKHEQLEVEQNTLLQQMDDMMLHAPTWHAEDLLSMRTWVAQVQPCIAAVRAAEQDLQDVRKRSSETNSLYQQKAAEMRTLLETAKQLEHVWRDLEEARKRSLTSSEKELIRELAARLQTGVPCPVCGSAHHPSPARQDAENELGGNNWSAEDDAAVAQAEETWRQADKTARQAETTCAQLQTAAEMLADEANRKAQHYDHVLQELLQYWPPCGATEIVDFSAVPHNTPEWQIFVANFNAAATKASEELQQWEDKRRSLADSEVNLHERLRQTGQQLALAQASVEKAEHESRLQAAELKKTKAARQAAEAELVQVIHDLDICVQGELNQSGAAAIKARLDKLDDDDRIADEAQRSLMNLNVELTQAQTGLQEVEREIQQLESAVREHGSRVGQLREDINSRQTQLNQITGGSSVADAIQETEQILAELNDANERAEALLQAAMHEAEKVKQAAARAEAELESQKKTAAVASERLTDALARAGFATIQAVEDARLEEEEQRERALEVAEYEEAVRQWTSRTAALEQQLAGRSLDESTWMAVQQDAAATEEAYRTALETYGSQQARLQDILRRKERWQELEQKRLEVEALSGRLSALQSAFRGNSFVQYVAREQMERVARQASDRLAGLTRGRYALTLTDDGSFLMRDDHNGGALRPVTTLSGGETFLTSLSLALALSAHIQLRGQHPLEFFFLDEGFGTLDPDLLDVVISSLEKLNLERLSIGLISHVPELRQRMQRRLVVDPAAPAGRGTKVSLEMA